MAPVPMMRVAAAAVNFHDAAAKDAAAVRAHHRKVTLGWIWDHPAVMGFIEPAEAQDR
jgi:hypothetical protein